jgi:hypothetical protein
MRAHRGLSLALALAGAAAAFAGGVALAQTGNAIAVPPPPPIMAAPSSPPPQAQAPAQPPGLAQTPPVNADNGAATPATGAPPATMPVTNDWTPGKTAELGVLDRVDGGIANLNIPVGGQVTSGDLQISVLACVMRPANQVPDAAIYLNVQTTDSKSGPPIFHGWMVRSIPAATVVGDSSETLRVANCT